MTPGGAGAEAGEHVGLREYRRGGDGIEEKRRKGVEEKRRGGSRGKGEMSE